MNIRKLYPHYSLLLLQKINSNYTHPIVGQIQKLLSVRGLYTGSFHSTYDEDTAAAVRSFQLSENLPATGRIDPVTYCRLEKAISTSLIPPDRSVQRNHPSLSLPRANIRIARQPRQLTLFDGNSPLRQYPIGIGKSATPTPLGNFSIALKVMNPGGVLGTRWLGLNFDAYGIHGTNRPWLIGQMVSNGCIRMHNANVEELYALVHIGTPVFIRD
ncbi:hypothetical protein P22_1533 [Propionispora sp. 2/2-37]|uniref:L,D-transpeptidase family protein n=1 Tax=Propionispora sp. 2/2-37 TaxID=1677858 RepID=UPI0006C108A4|nr:L,D-transpeptidase family protein [Propionispora sp. 2/2-37]CUH95462.1 hypothetical protein P22_1533 [Propionispora sp. 2/2-37]